MSEPTPLMKQYDELKREAGNALLFFRMGDFYELFGEDAKIASRILSITLTSRNKNDENPLPMAGVPHHSSKGYVQKLLNAGQKVAIAEQVEEPTAGKGIVRREIVRTFTPAIQFEDGEFQSSLGCYLATWIPARTKESLEETKGALALLDPSTGDFLIHDGFLFEEALQEMERRPVKHFVFLDGKLTESQISQIQSLRAERLVEVLPSNTLLVDQGRALLQEQFQIQVLPEELQSDSATLAAGVVLKTVLKSQKQTRLGHIRIPQSLHMARSLKYGTQTPRHLDLFPTAENLPNLFDYLNRTKTSMGARELRRWILEPLIHCHDIASRQTAIRGLSGDHRTRGHLQTLLNEIYDLDRIAGRIHTGMASPRDSLAMARSIRAIHGLIPLLRSHLQLKTSAFLERLVSRLERRLQNCFAFAEKVLKEQLEPAPLISRDGGIFNPGTHPELDRILDLINHGQDWLVQLEKQEREKTGIGSLKVRYNRVFGYYIEITKTNLASVPTHYQRKQSMANAERFYTEELSKFEEEYLSATTRQKNLEQSLFQEILEGWKALSETCSDLSYAVGVLDCTCALSEWGSEPGWCFPVLDESDDLELQASRHPIVDQHLKGQFVPNNISLQNPDRKTLLITGPNMGGKSTVMRQVALTVILGQMGCAVPAQSARWGVFQSVFTRIGAHDSIATGQSTFMVEMSELAQILRMGDSKSLIILDEIGRGTSTYDGISVAWATLEWICRRTQARTFFATHYHELTHLEGELPGLKNTHMAVAQNDRASTGENKDDSQKLRFLYEMREGATNESFGIQVAALAGLPNGVIERAWTILDKLESQTPRRDNFENPDQLSFFDWTDVETKVNALSPDDLLFQNLKTQPESPLTSPSSEIAEDFLKIDVNSLTPLQALQSLADYQDRWSKTLGREPKAN